MDATTLARPTIGIVSALEGDDREAASGTPWSMTQALRRHVGEVVYLGPNRPAAFYALAALDRYSRAVVRRRYKFEHSPILSRRYASYFDGAIRRAGNIDLLFAPRASTEIAHLRSPLPLLYNSDATPALLADYYPDWQRLLPISVTEAERAERRAIARADLLVYPTQWVADSAIRDYGADPAKVHVVGPGPNIWPLPPRDTLARGAPSRDELRLLMLAVEWERKGGPIVLDTLRELRRRGIGATLTICGVEPAGIADEPGVRVVGRLRKNVPAERERLERELLDAHLLFLPTRAECFGIVFCEAAAYGVPSISTATGGVSGVVRDGVNGYTLPLEAGAAEYADVIERLAGDPDTYTSLAANSRRFHEEYLSWDVWGESVGRLVREMLARKGARRSPGAVSTG